MPDATGRADEAGSARRYDCLSGGRRRGDKTATLASRDATVYDSPMPNARCRICRTSLPRGRRRYCTEACVAEGRRRRRCRRPDRRSCAWCRKRFPRTRKGHRFCSDVCRKAAHRSEPLVRRLWSQSRRRALPEPQLVPAPTWLQIYTDAGRGEGAWWGAAVIYRHRYPPGAQPEPLGVLRDRILCSTIATNRNIATLAIAARCCHPVVPIVGW